MHPVSCQFCMENVINTSVEHWGFLHLIHPYENYSCVVRYQVLYACFILLDTRLGFISRVASVLWLKTLYLRISSNE